MKSIFYAALYLTHHGIIKSGCHRILITINQQQLTPN
jgi:hypothetical protein